MARASVSAEELSRLLSTIYDAALAQAGWDSTVRVLSQALRAGRTNLRSMTSAALAPNGDAVGGYAFMLRCADNRRADGLSQLAEDAKDILASGDRCSCGFNTADTGVFPRLVDVEGTSTSVALAAPGSDAFGGTEGLAMLRLLLPHLRRAARVRASIAELTFERDQALRALNLLTNGVLIVGEGGKLLFANTAANAILARRDGLATQEDGAVTATCHRDNVHFQRLLNDTCGTTAPSSSPQRGGSLSLARRSGRSKLVVHIAAFRDRNYKQTRDRCAFVTVIDLDGDHFKTHPHVWRGLYNLTTTEATVAEQVSRGEGLKAVAAQLSVSLSTVRVHLQHVFEKTGTHRQAELVRLVLSIHQGAMASSVPEAGENDPAEVP